jgi:hypothetical protein
MDVDRRGQRVGINAFSLHPDAMTDLTRQMTEDDTKAFGTKRVADGTLIIGPHSPWRFKTVPHGAAVQRRQSLPASEASIVRICDITEAVPADCTGSQACRRQPVIPLLPGGRGRF